MNGNTDILSNPACVLLLVLFPQSTLFIFLEKELKYIMLKWYYSDVIKLLELNEPELAQIFDKILISTTFKTNYIESKQV